MAVKIPVKAIYDGSNVTALGEFTSGDTISTTYTDAKVTSVAGQVGAISNAQLQAAVSSTGVFTTANVSEDTNLYFTNARVYANVTQLGYATTTYVDNSVANVIGAAPSVLDTLKELADAVNNDPSFFSNAATASSVAFNQANAAYSRANVAIESLTTANVVELTNLYYTNARVWANVSPTLVLKANVTDLTTSNVVEGTSLYYTDTRARQSISVTGAATYDNSTGVINVTGGVTSVGGATGAVSNIQLVSGITQAGVLNTANVAEGNNLYYTVARANTAIDNRVTKSFVDNLGINATTLDGIDSTAFALDTDLTTANVSELTNLYFTNTRARDAISVSGAGSYDNTTGVITITGGVTSVAGATGAISNVQIAAGVNQTGILNTSNVVEGSNLYFTNARVYANVTQLGYATTTYVSSELANLVASAPTTLDTLNELATALGNDPNFATSTATLIGGARNQANAAYDRANVAVSNAEAAFDKANVTYQSLTTSNVTELSNLYFTNARSRAAISVAGAGSYDSATGVITITGGVTSVGGATGAISNVQLAAGITTSGVLNTSNVAEGSNLYFTNARSIAAFTAGTGIDIAANGRVSSTVTSSITSYTVNQSSHGLSVGNVIYHTGTVYAKAQANDANTLGIAIVSAVADTDNFTVATSGLVTGLSGLTAGDYYFVSASSSGNLTSTEPGTGYSNPILYAVSSTSGIIVPFRPAEVSTSTTTSPSLAVSIALG